MLAADFILRPDIKVILERSIEKSVGFEVYFVTHSQQPTNGYKKPCSSVSHNSNNKRNRKDQQKLHNKFRLRAKPSNAAKFSTSTAAVNAAIVGP